MIIDSFDYMNWSYCVPTGSGVMAYDMIVNSKGDPSELIEATKELVTFSNYLIDGIKELTIKYAEIEIINKAAGLCETATFNELGVDFFEQLIFKTQQEFADNKVEKIIFRIDEFIQLGVHSRDFYDAVALSS